MKKAIVFASLLALFAISSNAAHAELIAFWNFNSGSSATSGTFSSSTLAVTHGSGTLTFTGGDPDSVVVFAGSVTNLPDPDPDGTGRGVALAVRNADDGANNGSFLEFTLDMSGLRDLVMSYATQRTTTGFTSQAISFSADGAAFQDVVTFDDLPSSMGTLTANPDAIMSVDFGSFTEISDSSDVRIRLTMDGGSTTAPSGNNRFDNFQFNAVVIPEPASAVLMLLAGVGLVGLRRRASR